MWPLLAVTHHHSVSCCFMAVYPRIRDGNPVGSWQRRIATSPPHNDADIMFDRMLSHSQESDRVTGFTTGHPVFSRY